MKVPFHRCGPILLFTMLLVFLLILLWGLDMKSQNNAAAKLLKSGDVDGCMRICQQVITDPKASPPEKKKAYQLVAQACRSKQNPDAAQAYEELAKRTSP